jgi:preprotein translocase subunit SecE
MADKLKLVIAALIVVAALAGYYYFSASPMIARIGIILAGFVVAAAVGWTSAQGKQFHAYVKDSIAEAKKVVWPARKETMQVTGVVVAFVIVMALFLWVVDVGLMWAVRALIGRGA